jgi:CubicO group peptidase (beta-lactamase class C family)
MRLPWFVAGLASLGWIVATPAAAQGGDMHALDAADVGVWLDGTMSYAIKTGDVAGAVVVVVKDGQVLAGRGYGFADVAAGRRVDPERTLFRQGSISKLFTWTAMMQLVEAGALDLDKDVNAYLDFRLPPHAGRPITLRELATHTAGFEDILKGLSAADGAPVPSLGEVVKAEIPERIYAAGEVPAYCNYGATLAGYIVQRVSGEAFDAYVARHIFQPLGMTRSTFAQPPPAALLADMAQGYRNGSDPPGAFERTGMVPAGALSATGLDIARFMIAHLQDGRYGEARILKPETARRMHATAFQPYAPFPGMALGFYREDRNGRAIVGHAGDTTLFHSDLHLFLDAGVGLYISMNASGRDGASGRLRKLLFQEFADRYFPAPARPPASAPPLPVARAEHDAALAAGSYVSTRRVESGFPRMVALVGEIAVKAGAGGTLVIDQLKTPGGAVKRWREVGPFVWQEVGGTARLMAKLDHGRIVTIDDDGPAIFEYQRAAGIYAPINLTLLLCSIAVLAAAAALWPIAALVRRRYRAPLPLAGRAAMLHRLERIAAVVAVVAVAGWLVFLNALESDLSLFNASADPWLRSVQLLLLAAGPGGAILAAANLAEVWRRGARGWWARAWSLVLLLAFLDLTWIAFALKLVTVSTRF